MPWPRTIVHADMDAFFASVEQLDHPELRGKPLLIGHPGRRGVVSTASYEARPFGVGSAMPMAQARRLCPQAIVIAPRFRRYQEASRQVMEVFKDFSPLVEPLSLDEAFLDMTGAEGVFGPPEKMGRALKDAVREATGGLTVSVGIAPTKYVAKVGSDHDKPNGLTIIEASMVQDFLRPLPVKKLWGVGPKGVERLTQLGLTLIGDVARADRNELVEALGSLGDHIWRLAHNVDPRDVIPHHRARSIGSEETLDEDVVGAEAILPYLLRSADRIAYRLRKAGLVTKGLRVKLKTRRFVLHTRQVMLPSTSANANELYEAAVALLPRFDLSEPMRLIGMAAFQMQPPENPGQLDLFSQRPATAPRADALDKALDGVRDRFGAGTVKRASDLEG